MNDKKWMYSLILALGACLLSACNDDDEGDFDDLRAFNTSGAYASVIADCVKADAQKEYCSLSKLPLLGQETESPTVNDIMNRLVISHDWMADNFEEILYSLPEEFLPLFKALTAVVIDDDIRPAYYTTSTGAIYLDPAYLWTSVADKQTINPKEDYRAGFDDELAFRALGYYTQGNDYAFRYGSLTDNSTRSIEDTTHLLARLLLHELAHANDFIPSNSYTGLDTSLTVNQTTSALASQRPSNALNTTYPLESQLLFDLAEVMYFGETASSTLRAVSAEEAGTAFEPDGASDHYGYSNQFEDAAMLFETALMKQFFDFDYDVSFIDVPADENDCENYIVRWGQFNRVGDSEVKERAQYIIGEFLPNLDTTLFFQDLDTPVTMENGLSWCENLANKTFDATNSHLAKPATSGKRTVPLEPMRRPYL